MRLTVPQLAERYGCSVRTVWRMRARGVDVHDVFAVADCVLENPCVRLRMVNAVATALREVPKVNGWEAGWREGLTPKEK